MRLSMSTKKFLAFEIVLLVLVSVFVMAEDATKTVPSDIGERIRNVQLDISKQQTSALQLQVQYQGIQQTLAHDQGELDSLIKEALKSQGLSEDSWSVDTTNCCPMKFLAKDKPAKPIDTPKGK